MSATAAGRRRKKNMFSLVKFCRNFLATTDEDVATAADSSSSLQMTSLQAHRPVTSSPSPTSSEASLTAEGWFTAVAYNDLPAVSYYMSHGADVNMRCPMSGWSALHISAWNGQVDLTQLLLQSRHCQVDVPGPGSVTPVFLAAQQRHNHVIQLLIGAGCDVTKRATLRMRGSGCDVASDVTVLHVAAQSGHVGVVAQLLAAGVPIDATMRAGQLSSLTSLHLAVEAGHSDVIQLLIDAGSDVNGRTTSSTSISLNRSSNCSSCSTTV